MQDLEKGGAKIVCVAFPPQGGNSWSVVANNGALFNRNIPDECDQKMGGVIAGWGEDRSRLIPAPRRQQLERGQRQGGIFQ